MAFNLICFGGLPRACSTVLLNVLAQNPKFTASPTSSLSSLPFGIVDSIKGLPFIPDSQKGKEYKVARDATYTFLADTVTTDIYIDKGRDWIVEYAKTKEIFPDAKFIVLVRDIRGCFVSCNELSGGKGLELFNNLVVPSIAPLTETFKNGTPKDVFLIKAEEFTIHPIKVLNDLYTFLGMDVFEHNLENIETLVDDPTGKITKQPDLHKVIETIIPLDNNFNTLLGKSTSDFILKRFESFYNIFYTRT